MTNQTIIYSVTGLSSDSIALVTTLADRFQHQNVNKYFNFKVMPVVVMPATDPRHNNWYTIQVNYYDPTIQ